MIEVKNETKNRFNNNDLKVEFFKLQKDEGYKKFTDKINLKEDEIIKYAHSLNQCYKEEENCKNCKGIEYCKNEVSGCKYSYLLTDGNLNFDYKICKYKSKILSDIEYIKDSYLFSVSKDIRNAKMKDIYTDDKNRVEVIKWITSFIKNYNSNKEVKGLYLSGNFGSGKSYIVSAMINELVKNNKRASLVYYPELLRSLKASFGKDFDEQFNHVKNVDLLLLDDIGAENITPWSRDEVLGPILQYRMNEKLPTFFTSNLNIKELENHLSIDNKNVDKLKAKRIIERIEFMCDVIELVSKNNRR